MSNNQLLDKPVVFEVNGNEVKLTGNTVSQYLTRGNGDVSEQEIVMFINLCRFQKLNPFLNEAYLIKFGSQPAQIIVSKEAFMKRAESHANYEGMEAGIIVERDGDLIEVEGAVKAKSDTLVGGWAKVHRNDRIRPIKVRISLEEFGKGQATWKEMPLNMIRKTAIVNALREAFPDNVGAMYTEEEAPPAPKEVAPVSEIIQQEVEQNANKEVVAFSDRKLPKKAEEPEEVIADYVDSENRWTPPEDDGQLSMFNDKQPPINVPEY